jgi:hypothetical protein
MTSSSFAKNNDTKIDETYIPNINRGRKKIK